MKSIFVVNKLAFFFAFFYILLDFSNAIKVPDKDTVHTSCAKNSILIYRIKKSINNRFLVASEALEKVWNCLLSLIVPNFQQIILATS